MEINKTRVFIYALTFLGYAFSGYGAEIITNLRDAVIAAESVFGSFLKNAITWVKQVKNLHDVFDAAIEETCVFSCPRGEKPKKNKYHTPSSDGCGSQGLKIDNEYLPVGDMTNCCNDHDICYDTCGSDKEKCDLEFKRCLYKICEKHQKLITDKGVKACKAAAKMLFTGTLTLGCKSFLDSQKRACFCPSSKRTEF
ncbi:group XIIA secretory phospholipase A2 [Schistocerca cancellata]|uniref:group XIIA secretory phospholipase A2 n=1 Tax=Schistocerca cancellata TaxID=274614 RepID=UPI002119B12D|nr:group XIIA secretory phospholipase A2 [Schistocerca cancellata]